MSLAYFLHNVACHVTRDSLSRMALCCDLLYHVLTNQNYCTATNQKAIMKGLTLSLPRDWLLSRPRGTPWKATAHTCMLRRGTTQTAMSWKRLTLQKPLSMTNSSANSAPGLKTWPQFVHLQTHTCEVPVTSQPPLFAFIWSRCKYASCIYT